MLAYADTEIEQTLRNARLLFEQLDKVLDSPTEATEKYRESIEQLVETFKAGNNDISTLKADVERQYNELERLLRSSKGDRCQSNEK